MSTGKTRLAIVLLGAPNDEEGRLSSIAEERCALALRECRLHPDALVLPTGGFGDHFNTTDKPHAYYTRRLLVAEGVDEARFLPHAESRNTVEDAALAAPVLAQAGVTSVIIVTSDFHVARAEFLFKLALPESTEILFAPATTHLPEDELERLRAHERGALAHYRANPPSMA